MSYEVNFDSRTSAQRVGEVIAQRYGIDPDQIYVGDLDGLAAHGRPADVIVTPAPEGNPYFTCQLQASDLLAEATGGITELELASQLCQELDTRAIVADGGMADTVWMLVTADGWHGRVVVDDRLDDEGFVILHAYQPIPTEPDIPVVDPPEWQNGWYPDGQIPT